MAETVPSISKPTVHVIKIRFNNIFKNEKVLFAVIAVSLSIMSLIIGMGLYSFYRTAVAGETSYDSNGVAMNELQAISAEDAGINVMNKTAGGSGMTGSQQGGNYLAYNNGNGIDPNSLLMASNPNGGAADGKSVLTEKRAVINVDDNVDLNPFLPVGEVTVKKVKKAVKPNPNFLLPPASVPTNSTAKLLLATSVAGIMYDTYSPSAIIKINNTDYLVKRGDVINGYKILSISPKTVLIQLGKNVYNAPVGIILASLSSSNNTSTGNLSGRFGGNTAGQARYRSRK